MEILEDLKARNILKAVTNEIKFNHLKKGSGVYIGFDPTAKSLHLGNYIQIALLLRMQKAGFKAFAILGGATSSIGDPSGKNEERKLLDKKTLAHNSIKIKNQLESFGLKVIDNNVFYNDMTILKFLRLVGKEININYMLGKEVVSTRLATGISFAEFSYQLIQGYDFYRLYKDHNIQIQMGGSDQWGNITTGIELIRKLCGEKNLATGIITNLMTTSKGEKLGKSEKGAIWIDKNLTSAYELYQHLLSTSDSDLETLFNWFTFLDISKIKTILKTHNEAKSKKYAQKELAKLIVTAIHSKNDYQDAKQVTKILFSKQALANFTDKDINLLKKSIPTTSAKGNDFQSFLVNNKIVFSRRAAREAIQNKIIRVNGLLIDQIDYNLGSKDFINKAILVQKGKKNFFLVLNNM